MMLRNCKMAPLDFNDYMNYLNNNTRRQSVQWTADGPIDNLKHIKNFFASRLAKYPSRKGIRTPRELAKFLHKYMKKTPTPGFAGHRKLEKNLKDAVSTICQNTRGGQCTQRYGRSPYFIRDVNPGCAMAACGICTKLYKDSGVHIHGVSQKCINDIAKRAAQHFIQPRRKIPGTNFYATASCPCLNVPQCAFNAYCKWHNTACTPASNAEVGFPGIQSFAGQRYSAASQLPRKPGSRYVQNKTIFWQVPNGTHPLIHLADLLWP